MTENFQLSNLQEPLERSQLPMPQELRGDRSAAGRISIENWQNIKPAASIGDVLSAASAIVRAEEGRGGVLLLRAGR